LITRSRPVKPRATLIALIAASVPEDTKRTWSQPGTLEQIASARRTSPGVGAPYVVPREAASQIAAVTAG
jgi:hypothetical protein